MRNRFKKAILLVLLIQVILFGISIFGGNTIQNLLEEYVNILENHVSLRKNYIQDEMLQYWSNLTDLENYLQKEVKELGVLDNLTLIPELLEKVVDRTVFSLRQSGVTEIFIILEGEKGHEGIHLRDLDPTFNSSDNSDILMERGSIDIARKIGVPLDSQWANKFKLLENENSSEFYYKPFNAAKSYKNIDTKDLGYWSRPFRLGPDDIEIITYSLPLLDKQGKPYGVIGLGLTVDYMSGKLKYDELVGNKRGAYLLSVSNKDKDSIDKIISSGPMYNMLVDSTAKLYKKEKDENFYIVKGNEKIDGDVYASEQYLNLYNANTPFENDRWSLTGFVEKKDLFRPIKQIINSIIFSLIISLSLGILAVYIVGNWFMKPVNKLMKSVIASKPDDPFKLVSTNILEIDELGLAIETLNNEVLESASKLSKIINMVNVPIGAFEYTVDEERAFCTNTVFEILGIQNDNTSNYIPRLYLKEIIENIKKEPEIDIANIYRYKKDDGKTSWIQLIVQEQKGKVLGVIEDVTDEILFKRKIEYERDHDVLTHLFNRRAFEVLVRKKMQKECVGYSAFVMWDLDNLKYINDTYGHEYGDRYIQKAASVLNKFTIYNAIVARMSGDEFYTFIYGYKEKEDIRNIVNKIKTSLNNTFLQVPDGESIRIRASAGIAWSPDDSENYEELIKYSDFAMYEVKNKEKGNISEFNRDSFNKDSILLHGKEELNHFIDQGLVKYAFQPIIDVKTGGIFAYEALMRPQTKNLKSPYDVIRLASSQSKLYEIEKLTLFEGMKAFEEQKKHFKGAKIFINSIPNHVLSDEDIKRFEDRFINDLDRLVVEVTENEQSDEECTRIKQKMVAKWGAYLALDDFGSGYNSEVTLLILSPKYVKIDMNIIRGIDTDLNRQKLLKNMLSYAKNRDIKIIAEGIETKDEMKKLIEFGVDYMQGYYLGKPNMIPQDIASKKKLEIRLFHKEVQKI